MAPNLLSLLIISLMTFLSFYYVDLPLAQYVESQLTPLKTIATGASLLGHVWPWLGLALGLMIIRQGLYRRAIPYVLLSYGVTAVILAIIKLIAGRYRPGQWFSQELYGFNPGQLPYEHCSFPSGHSQTIFAFMVAFGYLYPKGRYFFWSVAATVSLSRILVNYHYFSDVLIGSYIGIAGTVWVMTTLYQHEVPNPPFPHKNF